jgi:hypothetical protein
MIRQFWVMSREGLCYFYRTIDKLNKQGQPNKEDLVSGMFSAILSLSKELTNTDIKKFENYSSKFLFFLDKSLIFIVEADLGDSDKNVKKKVDLIKDLFIKKYEKELNNFKGDVTQFKPFEQELDNVFKKISLAEEWGKELTGLKL